MFEMAHGQEEGDLNNYLFSWMDSVTHSTTGLAIMTVVVFLLSVMLESMNAGTKRLRSRPLFWIRSRAVTSALHNLLATLVHAVSVSLMFLLMLVFMTLNPWLCSAIILGAIVGYLLFNWSTTWDSEPIEKYVLSTNR
ncbi:high affinity copper uptake protein 1-like [Physella acuta]|uniref:high affinity copper uptake protein 1-like n=1 Tax=Physella acuta TaxID=109671 RepID=UPI0027DBF8D5|nr:high affinity copper uptake protein 1-like [Physella acuta]XP_059175328.1 high affinity copper uptake protein 1-like [Physella acuta]